MLKILKFFGGLLVLFVTLAAVLVGTFLLRPSWIINTRTVTYVVAKYTDEGEVKWSNLEISISREDWLRHTFEVEVKGLNVNYEGISVQASKGFLKVALNYHPSQPLIEYFGPTRVDGLSVNMKLKADQDETPSDLSWLPQVAQWVSATKFGAVDVELRKLLVEAEKHPDISGDGELHISGLNENSSDSVVVNFRNVRGLPIRDLRASVALESYQSILDPKGLLAFKARAVLERGDSVDVKADYRDGRELTGQTVYDTKLVNVLAKIQGIKEPGRFEATSRLLVSTHSKKQPDVHLQPCRTIMTWEKTWDDDISLELNCKGHVAQHPLQKTGLTALLLPHEVPFDLTSRSTLEGDRDDKSFTTINRLTVPPLESDLLRFNGGLTVNGRTPLNELSFSRFQANFDFESGTEQFQKLVGRLRATASAIPAPFNQLDGKVGCKLNGRYSWQNEKGLVPLECAVDLKSEFQKYNLTSAGSISLDASGSSMKPEIILLVDVNKIEFHLPDFKLGEPIPSLVKDKRFVRQQDVVETTRKSLGIGYDITIQTPLPDGIVVHSNLIEGAIPLALNARLRSNSPSEGKVEISRFGVKAYRREATVESFSMVLAEKKEDQEIKGLIRFPNNDYQIFMDIGGTVAKPTYGFRSIPYLPNRDILAVIIFGRIPDGFDSDNQRSADDAYAAVVSGAVNLASMYYLASSPIESINYNPSDKIFSAKVAVRDGLSVIVGANTEAESQFGVAKRIGGGWTVEASNVHDEDDDSNRGVAMLKWSRRY